MFRVICAKKWRIVKYITNRVRHGWIKWQKKTQMQCDKKKCSLKVKGKLNKTMVRLDNDENRNRLEKKKKIENK